MDNIEECEPEHRGNQLADISMFLSEWDERIYQYRKMLCTDEQMDNKYALLTRARELGTVKRSLIDSMLEPIARLDGESDFKLIFLIRLLYFSDDKVHSKPGEAERGKKLVKVTPLYEVIESIDDVISNFPFWVNENGRSNEFKDIVFWSENHILMYLSSAHLYNARATAHGLPCRCGAREDHLLKVYLRAHVEFSGVYEVLSHVYLPYTLIALLNLFDFSHDEDIQEYTKTIINIIMIQIFTGCSSSGVCNLTATMRSNKNFRTRIDNHNINQLILLCMGISPDKMIPTALGDTLATTKWRPIDPNIASAIKFRGFHSRMANHSFANIENIYERCVLEVNSLDSTCSLQQDDLLPFYWSAGLITHPSFMQKTLRFQRRHKLLNNVHLWWLRYTILQWIVLSSPKISTGQMYVDAHLNVFKGNHGLVLSSFERFNAGRAGFQQLPWLANINGVGCWTQSGNKNSVAEFSMLHTHQPNVIQRGGALIAIYAAPDDLTSMLCTMLFDRSIRLILPPRSSFDEARYVIKSDRLSNAKGEKRGAKKMNFEDIAQDSTSLKAHVWFVGRRSDVFIGMYCSEESTIGMSDVSGKCDDQDIQFLQRLCTRKNHFWVCLVATSDEYESLEDFLDRRICVADISEGNNNSKGSNADNIYFAELNDAVEGSMRVEARSSGSGSN